MTTHKDGRPAFTHTDSMDSATRPGMTLRDYFAAKAMLGDIMHQGLEGREWGCDHIAGMAYEMADAMLKAREVGL